MRLKPEEMLAIRWHMGMFDMAENGSSQRYAYYAATEKSALVNIVQAADMLTSKLLRENDYVLVRSVPTRSIPLVKRTKTASLTKSSPDSRQAYSEPFVSAPQILKETAHSTPRFRPMPDFIFLFKDGNARRLPSFYLQTSLFPCYFPPAPRHTKKADDFFHITRMQKKSSAFIL